VIGRRRAAPGAAIAAALVVLVACSDGGDGGDGGSPTPTSDPAALHAIAPTRRCLADAGAVVGPVEPRDERFRALADLAQRRSFEATVDGTTVGVAFTTSASEAAGLAELLTVPDDRYRLVVEGNVVLLHEPADERAAAVVRGCLAAVDRPSGG